MLPVPSAGDAGRDKNFRSEGDVNNECETGMNNLVLSIFPGIDLLGRAFEEEGYCVVRGPDILWGGDIRTFHPPAGVFEGVIGGPPCQAWSSAAMNRRRLDKDLIPEFERVIREVMPVWFLMENTRRARQVEVKGYKIHSFLFNNRWSAENITGPEQNRIRRLQFGSKDGRKLIIDNIALFMNPHIEWCVTASEISKGRPGHKSYRERYKRRSIEKICELMGVPINFFGEDSPFTKGGKCLLLGNAVPLPMGRAIAKAVKAATL